MNSIAKKQKSIWFLNQKYSHLWSAKEFVTEIMFCDILGQMFCSEIIHGEQLHSTFSLQFLTDQYISNL